jgi:hypothetical protein
MGSRSARCVEGVHRAHMQCWMMGVCPDFGGKLRELVTCPVVSPLYSLSPHTCVWLDRCATPRPTMAHRHQVLKHQGF